MKEKSGRTTQCGIIGYHTRTEVFEITLMAYRNYDFGLVNTNGFRRTLFGVKMAMQS